MNRFVRSAVVVGAFAVCYGAAVSAEEVNVRLRAGVAVGEYAPEFQGVEEYKASYVAAPVGLTFILENGLYVDVLHQTGWGDGEFDGGGKEDFTRDDSTLTIGARKGNFSFYAGYKTGEAVQEYGGAIDPDRFSTSGFLAGLGWARSLGSGTLSLGTGLGIMRGEYSIVATEPAYIADSTFGISVNAGYALPITEHFLASLDARYQSYTYDFEGRGGDPDFEIVERLYQIGLTIMYTF